MKVLFVYRVYGKDEKNPVVQNQIKSLQEYGLDIVEYKIAKGGVLSYVISIIKLFRFTLLNKFDVTHAHYSFSGFLAQFGSSKPVVCSLMGSDVLRSGSLKYRLTTFFSKFLWKKTIVKSSEMSIPNSVVVPNGIDLTNFRPIDKEEALKSVNFDKSKVNIIFVATDIDADVKNFKLAKETVDTMGDDYRLHPLSNIDYELLPFYYSASDLLLLTSKSEGSPNVIKEAMACNCPIVSTDVGDVARLNSNNPHCQIVEPDIDSVAKGIIGVLNETTIKNSREYVKELSTQKINGQLEKIYKEVANK